METWKDLSKFATENKDLIGFILVVVGSAIALARYSYDKAWERNKFAHDYADQIYADPACRLAMDMIDWNHTDTPKVVPECLGVPAGCTIVWSDATVAHALRLHAPFSPEEYLIRGAFDALLNRLDRVGFAVRLGLLIRAEFPTSLNYYFNRLEQRQLLGSAFAAYAERYGFKHVPKLWPRLRQLRTGANSRSAAAA